MNRICIDAIECMPNSCSLIHDTAVHVWDERRPYVPTDSFYHHRDVVTGLAWSPMSSCFLFATSKVVI